MLVKLPNGDYVNPQAVACRDDIGKLLASKPTPDQQDLLAAKNKWETTTDAAQEMASFQRFVVEGIMALLKP
jgi:hypothetical protein